MFFAFDGIDGTGKSTQARLLGDWLRAQGREVVTCVDPGSTGLGEAVRGILLGHKHSIHVRSEMLLFMAARAQLVEEVIRPALEAGKIVVSDRFLLSNVVYQGHAGGLDVDELWQIGHVATDGIRPTLTFLLDMPPEAATARIGRELDRLESLGPDFRARLRAGFLAEAQRNPRQIAILNAELPTEALQALILQQVQPLLT